MSKIQSVIVDVGIFCFTLLHSMADSFGAQAAELRFCASLLMKKNLGLVMTN